MLKYLTDKLRNRMKRSETIANASGKSNYRILRTAVRILFLAMENCKAPIAKGKSRLKKLSIKEAAAKLGISKTTLWRKRKKGVIKARVEPDGDAYFLEHELDNYLLKNPNK